MDLKKKLDGRKDLQTMLFRRAWLISKDSLDNKMSTFPFYGNWKSVEISCLKNGLMPDGKVKHYLAI